MRTVWQLFLSLAASLSPWLALSLSAADSCREWKVWEAMATEGIPAGHTVAKWGGDWMLKRTSDNATWILNGTFADGPSFSYNVPFWPTYTYDGESIPPVVTCHDLEVQGSNAALITSWTFVGWWLGDTELPEPESGYIDITNPLNLNHGTHASWLGFGCVGCDAPGGGGGVNTNQFHLDVTNSLARIELKMDEARDLSTGGFSSSLTEALLDRMAGPLLTASNAVQEATLSRSNSMKGLETGVGTYVAPEGTDDLAIDLPGGGSFSFIAAPIAMLGSGSFAVVCAWLRFLVVFGFAMWFNVAVYSEVHEAMREIINQKSQTTASGGAIPGASAVVGAFFAILICTAALTLPALWSVYGEAHDGLLTDAAGTPSTGMLKAVFQTMFTKANDIPYVGTLLGAIDMMIPFLGIVTIIGNWIVFQLARQWIPFIIRAVVRLMP